MERAGVCRECYNVGVAARRTEGEREACESRFYGLGNESMIL